MILERFFQFRDFMFTEIKIQIIKKGRKCNEVAARLRWKPSKISAIIAGNYTPSSCEKEDLAAELETTVEALFNPDKETASL